MLSGGGLDEINAIERVPSASALDDDDRALAAGEQDCSGGSR
jgi:hypothetical protein